MKSEILLQLQNHPLLNCSYTYLYLNSIFKMSPGGNFMCNKLTSIGTNGNWMSKCIISTFLYTYDSQYLKWTMRPPLEACRGNVMKLPFWTCDNCRGGIHDQLLHFNLIKRFISDLTQTNGGPKKWVRSDQPGLLLILFHQVIFFWNFNSIGDVNIMEHVKMCQTPYSTIVRFKYA